MDNFIISKNNDWKEVEVNAQTIEIPLNWSNKKFKNFCSLSRGSSPRPIQNYITHDKNEIPWVKISDATKVTKYIQSTEQYITKNGQINSKVVEKGDLIVSNSASPGIPRFMQIKACIHDGWLLLRNFEGVDKEFLYHLINLNRERLKNQASGSIFTNLSIEVLNEFETSLPPLEQQNSIATILSAQEKIIEDTETLISKYEKRAAYLTEELLSGRLRVKEAEGETIFYKNPEDNWKEVEVNGETKEIPKDWTISKTKDITVENIKSKLQINQLSKKDTYPAFSCSENLVYYSKSYLIEEENIFLSTGGNAAVHYYNGKSAYSTDVYSVKTININTKIFTRILKHNINQINNLFYGAGLKHLNKSEFKNHEWIIPNQGNMLEKVFSQQESLIETKKLILSKEKIKFQWLLDNLLSGNYLIQSKNH